MGISAINNYVNKSYKEIKPIVNDVNREISKFNRQTIAKVVAFLAFITLSGAFSVFACINMGMAIDLASFAVLPSYIGGLFFSDNFSNSNLKKRALFIKNINKDLKEKLKSYTLCIKDAVFLNNKNIADAVTLKNDISYFKRYDHLIKKPLFFTISKIKLDSPDSINKRYQKDWKNHLPGFLQQTIEKIKKIAAKIAAYQVVGDLSKVFSANLINVFRYDDELYIANRYVGLFDTLAIKTALLALSILTGGISIFACMKMEFAVNLGRLAVSSLFIGGLAMLYIYSLHHKKEKKINIGAAAN